MADHNNFRALSIGYLLSDYRIEGILGEGGFGITYLAIDTSLGKRVAIKEYFPREFSARDGTLTIRAAGGQEDRETFDWGRARFLEEARTLALFQHPNIVAVRRFFEANGTAYLVMDYCDGEPLDEIIKLRGPLERKQLDRILFPLLDGLEVIHQAHFLHRDIKPANIFIREDGSPLLLDFGAARQETGNHSRSVTSLATAGYAAIEQYSTRGKQGPWTDIYGLGATLYRAVTGEKPQESTERMLEDSMSRAVDKARGRYPASLLAAIDAAMAVRPEQRPQSVAKFRSLISAKSSAHPNKLNEQDSKSVPTPIVENSLSELGLCPNCGKEIPLKSTECSCGANLSAQGGWKAMPVIFDSSSKPFPFFVVSVPKLITLSFFSFGLYLFYWFYKNWSNYKTYSSENISPGWRAFFYSFTSFFLFKAIARISEERGIYVAWNAWVMGLALIGTKFLGRLPDPFWLLSFLDILLLVPIQITLNNLSKDWGNTKVDVTFRGWSVAIIIAGYLFWILVLIGLVS